MKYLTLVFVSGVGGLFLSSCAATDPVGSSESQVRTSAEAYEIEQTKRYEFERREDELTWR